jgi:hypothetical protein
MKSIGSQQARQVAGNRVGQPSRICGAHRRQSQRSLQMVSLDAKGPEEARTLPKRMLGKDGPAESGLNQTLYCFGVEWLHHYAWSNSNLLEELIDQQAHVAPLRIKDEWNCCQLFGTN